jgi:hypothetical protein
MACLEGGKYSGLTFCINKFLSFVHDHVHAASLSKLLLSLQKWVVIEPEIHKSM